MHKRAYSHIIWDWNGTLLNDVEWCIAQINLMLAKRNKKTLSDIADYHRAFKFPIIEYYKSAGFDLVAEPFEILAEEFIDLYHNGMDNCVHLYTDAEYVLKTLHARNISQIMLSASKQNNLLSQISPFAITQYFDEILGISDIYAKSKVDIGLGYLSRNSVKNGILIGDTIHDYEVAQAMGIDCILVAQGHQSKKQLMSCGVPVVDSILEVLEFVSK